MKSTYIVFVLLTLLSALTGSFCSISTSSSGTTYDGADSGIGIDECGEWLCFWNVDQGRVEMTPTWHSYDRGVSMIGPRVTLSLVEDWSIESNIDLRCVNFEFIVDKDDDVNLTLRIDFQNDGIFEHNLIVFDSRVRVFVNVGPSTAPESFTFYHNAWYQPDGTNMPVLPTKEKSGIYRVDPKLKLPGTEDMHIGSGDRRLEGIGADAYQSAPSG